MKDTRSVSVLTLALALGCAVSLFAQPSYTVVPEDGGSISGSGSVVFTFDEPMDTVATVATFYNVMSPTTPLVVNHTWNPQMTVLTYTKPGGWPGSLFPGIPAVLWTLNGEALDPSQDPIDGDTGTFEVTSGGGGEETPSGTNAVTSYLVGKMHFYAQTNGTGPVLDPDFDVPYAFVAMVTLASNKTASAISVALPTTSSESLIQLPQSPEIWEFFDFNANLETLYPQGTYTFTLNSKNGNTTMPINFNVTPQPPAPRISNFGALQSVNPAQAFTLTWDAWAGNTTGDYIHVSVGTNFNTPEFDQPNALRGNATSVTVPANTLTPNDQHYVSIGFYRASFTTNTTEVKAAYRVTVTTTDLITTGSGTGGERAQLGNARWSGNALTFDVSTTPGQTLTIETSPSLLPGSWTTFYTTNAPGSTIRVADPRPPGTRLYYRVRNGS